MDSVVVVRDDHIEQAPENVFNIESYIYIEVGFFGSLSKI
jgi:hypothetical protein